MWSVGLNLLNVVDTFNLLIEVHTMVERAFHVLQGNLEEKVWERT